MFDIDASHVFAVFDRQDSGCVAHGVDSHGHRLFVKNALTAEGRSSLRRAIAFHRSVRHRAIATPIELSDSADGPQLVYPWLEGTVLCHATVDGPDRSGLARFQQLAVPEVTSALATILDAHLAVAAAGFVAVDLYDGCFLYDFDARVMHLIDFDEYRPGPFRLEADRLPGSRRYMAPEEFQRGSVIDERTTVFNLGRTLANLLDGPDGWRGSGAQLAVIESATMTNPRDRIPTVAALTRSWQEATA